MHIPEQDVPAFKKWIVKRLEDTSDADPDVLADYVVALLVNDSGADEASTEAHVLGEIGPFLTKDAKVFTSGVIQAIKYKSYLTGAAPAPPSQQPFANGSSFGAPNLTRPYFPTIPTAASHKRGFGDRDDLDAPDSHNFRGGARGFKQPRRGGGRRYVDPDRPPPAQEVDYGYNPRAPSLNFNTALNAGAPLLSLTLNTAPPGYASAAAWSKMAGFGQDSGILSMETMRKFQEMQQQFCNTFPETAFPGVMQQPNRRKGRCHTYDNKGYCRRGQNCEYEHNNDGLPAPSMSGQFHMPLGDIRRNSENLASPMFGSPSGRVDTGDDATGNDRSNTQQGQQRRPRNGGATRAPFSHVGPILDKSKTKVVVKNIPEENFDEAQVREFFARFGAILEVSMMPYRRLAVVTYRTWVAANAAWRFPGAKLGSRSIKVYWYDEEKQDATEQKDIVANPYNQEPFGDNGGEATAEPEEPEIDLEDFKRQQDERQKQFEEKLRIQREFADKRADLEAKSKELLARTAEAKQKLNAKLAARTQSQPGGADAAIVKDESAAEPAKPQTQTEVLRATLAKLRKEADAMGLDPHAQQDYYVLTSNPHSDLSYSSNPSRGRGGDYSGYRGGYNPRGSYNPSYVPRGGYTPRGSYVPRGGYAPRGSYGGDTGREDMHAAYAAFSLDNRPKKVALTGIDFTAPEKDDALRRYLFSLEAFKAEIQATPAKTIVSFGDRKTAEVFYNSVREALGEGEGVKLELSWVANSADPLAGSATSKIAANGNGNGASHGEASSTAAAHEDGQDTVMADAENTGGKHQQQIDGGGSAAAAQTDGPAGGDDEQDYDVAGENDWDVN